MMTMMMMLIMYIELQVHGEYCVSRWKPQIANS